MRTPSTETATNDLIRIGLYHLVGLERMEETAELAPAFRKANEALQAAWEARVAADRDRAPKCALVPLVDVDMDGQVLAFGDAVKAFDEAQGTQHFRALFPEGLKRVVEPVGAVETDAVQQILSQLKGLSDAGDLQGWADPLGKTLEEYEAAIQARDEAEAALKKARDTEEAARKAWFTAVAKHCDVLDESYPDSDATRLLFFPPGD